VRLAPVTSFSGSFFLRYSRKPITTIAITTTDTTGTVIATTFTELESCALPVGDRDGDGDFETDLDRDGGGDLDGDLD
jgi:hypothetical protein